MELTHVYNIEAVSLGSSIFMLSSDACHALPVPQFITLSTTCACLQVLVVRGRNETILHVNKYTVFAIQYNTALENISTLHIADILQCLMC